MDQLCLATSKLFDQQSKKDNEVDKNDRPNNEEWGAIIRVQACLSILGLDSHEMTLISRDLSHF